VNCSSLCCFSGHYIVYNWSILVVYVDTGRLSLDYWSCEVEPCIIITGLWTLEIPWGAIFASLRVLWCGACRAANRWKYAQFFV